MSEFPCWCGTDDYSIVFSVGTYALYHCPSCGTFRNNPVPLGHEDQASKFYTDYYSDGHASQIKKVIKRNSRFWKVHSRIPPSFWEGRKEVLDVGCGSGDFVAELGSFGWSNPKGSDIAKSRIQFARQQFPEYNFFDQDIAELMYILPAQDLIIVDNVIEHVPNPVDLVQNLKKMVGRNGAVVIITPNLNSGNFKLLGKRWTPELCPHTHIFLFTEKSLSNLVEKAGFTLKYHGNFLIDIDFKKVYCDRIKSLDIKGLFWRLMQDTGHFFGSIIGQGEMIYVIAVID